MESIHHHIETQHKLIADLKAVIKNAEQLLKTTERYSSPTCIDARLTLESTLACARAELIKLENRLLDLIEDQHSAADDASDAAVSITIKE
jgi:ElaB/YqjD/DUF883 family membrane-anchored ribosome-binding protein